MIMGRRRNIRTLYGSSKKNRMDGLFLQDIQSMQNDYKANYSKDSRLSS